MLKNSSNLSEKSEGFWEKGLSHYKKFLMMKKRLSLTFYKNTLLKKFDNQAVVANLVGVLAEQYRQTTHIFKIKLCFSKKHFTLSKHSIIW